MLLLHAIILVSIELVEHLPRTQSVLGKFHCIVLCVYCFGSLGLMNFGNTIPSSFNILMKCFYTCFTSFSWIPSSVHFCCFVECFSIPICLFYIYLVSIMLPQECSGFVFTRAQPPPILLVKDHTHKEKEPFVQKNTSFAVGQFRWRIRTRRRANMRFSVF